MQSIGAASSTGSLKDLLSKGLSCIHRMMVQVCQKRWLIHRLKGSCWLIPKAQAVLPF